jgi:hypothetical protein
MFDFKYAAAHGNASMAHIARFHASHLELPAVFRLAFIDYYL